MTRFQFSAANHPENYPAIERSAGLFWRTRLNGKRVGHGGNDPGVATLMMAALTGEPGIMAFCNTSLGGADQRFLAGIQDAVRSLS